MDEITYAVADASKMSLSCYQDVYRFLLACSQAHSPRALAVAVLDSIKEICPYDSAVAIFSDVNGEIAGWYPIGIREEYLTMPAAWYDEFNKQSAPELSRQFKQNEATGIAFSQRVDWTRVADSEYKRTLLDPCGAVHSWYFHLFDMRGIYRLSFVLNRAKDVSFSTEEVNRVELALPILNNMHRNLYYRGSDTEDGNLHDSWAPYGFTRRETDICDLLCQGVSIKTASSLLYISVSTTYKHMSHIYKKAKVSSMHELVAKLMAT